MPPRPNRLQTLLDSLKTATKDGAVTTAQALAEDLGISIRTLYRDLDRLRAAGVAVAGKTGVGLSVAKNARLADSAGNGRSTIEVRVRASAAGARVLGDDPRIALERGNGTDRVVRAGSREAIVDVVMRAAGEVVLLGPEKIRREVRNRARAVARAHKG